MNAKRFVLLLALAGCPKSGEDTVDPKVRADGHYLASQTAYTRGDFVEAHKQLDEVKKLQPQDARLPAAEGELFLSEGRVDDAIAAYERAVQLDAKRSTNWSRLGYLYSMKDLKPKAMEALNKALAANPKDFNALESLGDMALEAKDVDGGVGLLLRASEVAPPLTSAQLVLKATDELSKKGRTAEALVALEAADKRGVASSDFFVELGDQLAKAQRLDDSLRAYTKAAKGDPKDPTLWEIVGEVHKAQGHWAEAKQAYEASLKVQNRAVVHVALARLCLEQKDDGCAKSEVGLALEAASGAETREMLELADVLKTVGRKRDALEVYKTMVGEEEQATNLTLQLMTAQLAKELKDSETMLQACARVTAKKPGTKCP